MAAEKKIFVVPTYEIERNQKLAHNRENYIGNEESLTCGRFPHMKICACDVSCQEVLANISLIEVYDGIFIGPFQAGFKTGELIDNGITHILNVTNKSYTERTEFFKYLDIAINDDQSEDSKKHYRITNRFIHECVQSGGKILVQSVEGKSRCATFVLAYMIFHEKIKLKEGLSILRQFVSEVEPNEGFMQQLAHYDLELLEKND